jgi:HK97 family phage portal protein
MKWPWTKTVTRSSKGHTRNIVINDVGDSFLACSLLSEKITPQKAFRFYQQNSSVATAVDMIADAFKQIKPIIELADGSIIDNHPVLDLLQHPNSDMTWLDFAARMSRNYLLTNESHLYGMGVNTLPPQEIYPVKPIGVSVVTRGEYVSSYHIGFGVATAQYNEEMTKQKIKRYFDKTGLKEIYRIAGFSSMTTDASADSPLQAAALETNQQIKGRIHNTKVLDNGGRLSLLIVFKDESMTDDEKKLRSQRLNETIAGSENAGKILVTSGGEIQTVQEMGVSQKDMDYSQLDKTAGNAIYFRYQIPLPMVSIEASTLDNFKASIPVFYDFAVLPHADTLFGGLTRFLMPRFKIPLGTARITYNPDSLQPLRERKLKELLLRKEIGVETPDEIREGMPNRADLPNGVGKVVYQNASLVAMGTDINEDEPRTVGGE